MGDKTPPTGDEGVRGERLFDLSATVARRTDQSGTPIAPETDQERLEALRGRLEAVLADPETSARDLASVSREYRQTLTQLAEASPAAAGSALDEIAARRVRRGAS